MGDLQIGRRGRGHALANIHGKGGKHRQCPLWPRTEAALDGLVQGRAGGDAVFLSRHRRPYTRFGVYRLVERSAARVPSLDGRRVTPHTIRHTSASHLLRAGIDLNTIRAWLGQASLDTTNIYAEIDMDMKAKAMALCDAAEPGPDRPWKPSKGLMAFLGTRRRLCGAELGILLDARGPIGPLRNIIRAATYLELCVAHHNSSSGGAFPSS